MKRKWFQIHLSTAIVMMIVAAALLELNYCPWRTVVVYEPAVRGRVAMEAYGWPWPINVLPYKNADEETVGWQNAAKYPDFPTLYFPTDFENSILKNLAACLVLLSILAVISEFLVVRRTWERTFVCRSLFRLHLSTAIVMMIVASLCLWANIREQHIPAKSYDPTIDENVISTHEAVLFGWPTLCANRYWKLSRTGDVVPAGVYFRKSKIVLNVCVSLFVNLGCAAISEFLIRRRAREQT